MPIIEALAGRGPRVVSNERAPSPGFGDFPAPGSFIRPLSSASRSAGSAASKVMPSSVLFATRSVPGLMCVAMSTGGIRSVHRATIAS